MVNTLEMIDLTLEVGALEVKEQLNEETNITLDNIDVHNWKLVLRGYLNESE